MTLEEIQTVATDVLGEHLAKYGFREATVAIKFDEDGKEYLDISSFIYPGGEKLDPRASLRTKTALRHALFAKGEERFPVVLHRFPRTKAA